MQVVGSHVGDGFKYCLFSPRSLGKIPIVTKIFEMGWNHQLDISWKLMVGR